MPGCFNIRCDNKIFAFNGSHYITNLSLAASEPDKAKWLNAIHSEKTKSSGKKCRQSGSFQTLPSLEDIAVGSVNRTQL